LVQNSKLALARQPAAGVFVDLVRLVMVRWMAQHEITVKFASGIFPRFDCWNNSDVGRESQRILGAP
jgi:hypothetical protein